MKRCWLVILAILPLALVAQTGIHFSLANGAFSAEGGEVFFEFDVLANASQTGTNIGTGIVVLDYSLLAFGYNVHNGGNAAVGAGTLTGGPFYRLIVNDYALVNSSRLSITFEYLLLAGYGNPLPAQPTQLLHLKLKLQDPAQQAYVAFAGSLMEGEQYQDDNQTPYDPVTFGAGLSDSYEPTLAIELAGFTAAFNLQSGTVGINWVTLSETSLSGYRLHRGASEAMDAAQDLNAFIPATNSAQGHSYQYSDPDTQPGETYYYWLEACGLDGASDYHGPAVCAIPGENGFTPEIPALSGLGPLYPNPFSASLTIGYQLAQKSNVEICVFNLKGRMIRILDTAEKEAGRHFILWDGTDANGLACASGLYLLRLDFSGHTAWGKVMLSK